ncbi:MAG: DNA repair protein RecN [Gammaproteobacteria bacterium]|nr:DNA repair protein RecN [Gammaproteobacteria bacterium]
MPFGVNLFTYPNQPSPLMLNQLTIRNYVLVDHLDIGFAPGLTGITGESGAGKSILLGALGLLMGERARTDSIRPGADKADVSAEFALRKDSALHQKLLTDELIEADDDCCLVRRVVSAEGRSRAFINNVPVTVNYLKEATEHLVDIQDQDQHQRLSDRNVQRSMLDEYAEAKPLAGKVSTLWRDWQGSAAEIARLQSAIAEQEDRKNLLSYQIEEFDALSLVDGELATLEIEHKRLSQAQSILAELAQVQASMENLDDLRQASKMLEGIDDNHSALDAGAETLNSALALIDDANRDLRHYAEQVIVDPQTLADTEARLEQIYDLARKHRVQPERLAEHAQSMRKEFDAIASDRSSLEQLTAQEAEQQRAFEEQATKLSSLRTKKAKSFGSAVDEQMHALGIKEGELSIVFHPQQSEHGLEQIEFHVRTNKRFDAGPLNRIASGGEQTRINLAIQIVAAQRSQLPCLILDEADVGVGGTTADTVGRILRDLAERSQVICVTHAPQVAARSHNHMCVAKRDAETDITALNFEQRVEELARMLAGADVTDKTRDYAQTLLNEASTTAK